MGSRAPRREPNVDSNLLAPLLSTSICFLSPTRLQPPDLALPAPDRKPQGKETRQSGGKPEVEGSGKRSPLPDVTLQVGGCTRGGGILSPTPSSASCPRPMTGTPEIRECNNPAPGPNPDLELPPQACHVCRRRLTPGGSALRPASLPCAPRTRPTMSIITRIRRTAPVCRVLSPVLSTFQTNLNESLK